MNSEILIIIPRYKGVRTLFMLFPLILTACRSKKVPERSRRERDVTTSVRFFVLSLLIFLGFFLGATITLVKVPKVFSEPLRTFFKSNAGLPQG